MNWIKEKIFKQWQNPSSCFRPVSLAGTTPLQAFPEGKLLDSLELLIEAVELMLPVRDTLVQIKKIQGTLSPEDAESDWWEEGLAGLRANVADLKARKPIDLLKGARSCLSFTDDVEVVRKALEDSVHLWKKAPPREVELDDVAIADYERSLSLSSDKIQEAAGLLKLALEHRRGSESGRGATARE